MIDFPGAKINIGLKITEKREDGYHNIQTIFYPVRLYDILEFIVLSPDAGGDRLTVTGLVPEGAREDNLVIRALEIIKNKWSLPYFEIHLHKNIPAGAGLGGGSSDAAFMMKMLNKCFKLGLSAEELKNQALRVGSDAPFFIENIPSYAEGRGELLTPLNQLGDDLYLVIICPGIHISTREAYLSCKPEKKGTNLSVYYRENISKWKDLIENDFEKIVFPKHPVLKEIKELLYKSGAIFSSMSGSGSAIYGLFRKKPVLPGSAERYICYSGPL